MQRKLFFVLAASFVAAILFTSIVFTVDQRQAAIVFQLGEVRNVITEPGLAVKLPFIQNVRFFDKRILTMDRPDPERFMTAEKKPVLVDSYVKWRIRDVKLYYVSLNGGDENMARIRLAQTVNSSLKDAIAKRNVPDVVSGEREKIMAEVLKKADDDVRALGIEIVDVRLKRVDFPSEVSASVFLRMDTERKRVATELRSEGGAEAEKIKADADRQREVILADAYRQAQMTKGEGDAKAASIYAQAFSQNPEFYSFYRSLEAYRASFKSKSDVLVVEPNSDFFKYLKNSGKAGK